MKKMLLIPLTMCVFTIASIWSVSGTKEITQQAIDDNIRQTLINKLNDIIEPSQYDNDLLTTQTKRTVSLHGIEQTIVLYQAIKNNQHVAYLIQHTYPKGYSGDIVLLTGVDYQGRILGIRAISHRETPGLGDKIDVRKSDWILQFQNRIVTNTEHWKVTQEGGEFDALTGATITSKAIIAASYDVLNYVNNQLLSTNENN